MSIRVTGIKEALSALEDYKDTKTERLEKATQKATVGVQRGAKKNAPVDTGRLRSSIHRTSNRLNGVVFTNVEYACVVGRTGILTDNGYKNASNIKVGDKLLTQAGVYKPVTKVYQYGVPEGDELLTITAEWRSDKDHVLTLTPHHKVMVFRNGRNKFIEAQNINPKTDSVYRRKKKAHNKGSGESYICANCGDVFRGQNDKYCSWDCKTEHWYDKGNNPHLGMERSDEARNKMSESAKAKLEENPELHPSRIVAKNGGSTKCEDEVREFLDRLDVEFEEQVAIGNHIVDFYSEEHKTIVEADGAYWHQDQSKDIERDEAIIDVLGSDWKIYHLHFYSKRHSPELNLAPLPNVHYVPMNPGVRTYVNPDEFEQCRVKSIESEAYKRPHKRARKEKPVYDFEVKDIHSYYANGFLISNSYVEFGTGSEVDVPEGLEDYAMQFKGDGVRQVNLPAQPYLFPAWESYRPKYIEEIKEILSSIR